MRNISKAEIQPITCHESTEGSRIVAVLFL